MGQCQCKDTKQTTDVDLSHQGDDLQSANDPEEEGEKKKETLKPKNGNSKIPKKFFKLSNFLILPSLLTKSRY